MCPLGALISCPQIQPFHNFSSRCRRLSLSLARSSFVHSPVLLLLLIFFLLILLLLTLLLDLLSFHQCHIAVSPPASLMSER